MKMDLTSPVKEKDIINYLNEDNGLDLASKCNVILNSIKDISIYETWSKTVKLRILTILKSCLISEEQVNKIIKDKELETLSLISEAKDDIEINKMGLKCIANALLLSSKQRIRFSKYQRAKNMVDEIQKEFKTMNLDILFIYIRILFLVTIDSNNMIDFIIVEKQFQFTILKLVEYINNNKKELEYNNEMILVDILKLCFNLMTQYEKHINDNNKMIEEFKDLFLPLMKLLTSNIQYSSSPINYQIIQVIMQYPIEYYNTITYEFNQQELINSLLKPLYQLIQHKTFEDNQSEYEALCSHVILLTNLFKVYTEQVDKFNKSILPDEQNRNLPIGKAKDYKSQLVNVLVCNSLSPFKDILANFYFVLCKQDGNLMIQKLGYGNVAGFLANNNVPIKNYTTNSNVNPITGQFNDKGSNKIDMTDEEKEREAERLFVIFDRIKKNPAIQFKDPIQEAVDKGVFHNYEPKEDEDED